MEDTAQSQQNQPKEGMSFFDHLSELRTHLMRMVMFMLVFFIAAFIFKDFIFTTVLLGPSSPDFFTNALLCKLAKQSGVDMICINQNPIELINTTMTGQFTIHIMVALIMSLILAFPVIIYELWKFISPALYVNERRKAGGMLVYAGLLFFIGVLFGYYALVPLSINFLMSYQVSAQVVNMVTVSSYASLVATLSLACGLLFEMPILSLILTQLGIISPKFLKKYRRHAIIVIFIIAAIITPPDVFSQTLVAVPMLALYEISIWVSYYAKKKKDKIEIE